MCGWTEKVIRMRREKASHVTWLHVIYMTWRQWVSKQFNTIWKPTLIFFTITWTHLRWQQRVSSFIYVSFHSGINNFITRLVYSDHVLTMKTHPVICVICHSIHRYSPIILNNDGSCVNHYYILLWLEQLDCPALRWNTTFLNLFKPPTVEEHLDWCLLQHFVFFNTGFPLMDAHFQSYVLHTMNQLCFIYETAEHICIAVTCIYSKDTLFSTHPYHTEVVFWLQLVLSPYVHCMLQNKSILILFD